MFISDCIISIEKLQVLSKVFNSVGCDFKGA